MWTSYEYIFHFLKIQIHITINLRKELKEMENENSYKNRNYIYLSSYHIYHKKKKEIILEKKLKKFWDKKWRVLWRISWKSAIPVGWFSFLPSSGNRIRSAQVAKTKFITPCQLSHTYFREKIRVTRVFGERSRAQWYILVYEQRRVSFYYRSMKDRGYCRYGHKSQLFETLFLHSNGVKRFIEIRDSNHNLQDYDRVSYTIID